MLFISNINCIYCYRNNYKGHVDKNKGGWKPGREVGMAGVVGRGVGKRQKTVLEQQQNSKVFNKKTIY